MTVLDLIKSAAKLSSQANWEIAKQAIASGIEPKLAFLIPFGENPTRTEKYCAEYGLEQLAWEEMYGEGSTFSTYTTLHDQFKVYTDIEGDEAFINDRWEVELMFAVYQLIHAGFLTYSDWAWWIDARNNPEYKPLEA